MRKIEDFVKAVKAIEPINLKAADDQGKEAMTDLEKKPAKDPEKKELISDLEIRTTKPPIILPYTHMDCPFCESEKTIKGMNRHIAAKHKVPGITLQDLDDVEKGLKSLSDLVCEKFEGEPTIINLSPEIEEKEFSNWEDVEENPSKPEDLEDPEDLGPEERRKINLIPSFLFSPFDRRGRQ